MAGIWQTMRSLAIVGSHPATRELAPYDDPDFEIWLFNEAAQNSDVYRRWDAVLQMHEPEVYSSEQNWINKDHWAWLQQDHGEGKRIFMQDYDPRVPNSVRYPIEDVLSLVPYKYIRSSPAYALALGICLGYQHIQIYGSELSSNTEYRYQATNYAFWIGFAHGRGINLELKCWESEFNGHPLYGYEGEIQLYPELFAERMKRHEQEFNTHRRSYERLVDKMLAAMQRNKFIQVSELMKETEKAAMQTGQAKGRLDEAKRYAGRINPISRQEFERTGAQAQADGSKMQQILWHENGKCEYVWNAWKMTGQLEALNQLKTFAHSRTQAAFDTGRLLGIFKENMDYMDQYDELVTASGGQRAVSSVLQVQECNDELMKALARA